jgi:hypothetical protein
MMPQPQVMSLHEKLAIGAKAIELEKQGRFEEAEKMEKQIPMPPYLAKWAKDHMGADFLIKYGWNLSEAEAKYGHDWLNK